MQTSTSFPVSWTGTDEGAGIQDYTIYVSEDGSPATVWLSNTTDTSATFTGEPGKSYAFYSVARDKVGNEEDPPAQPDTTTKIGAADTVPPLTTPTPFPAPNANSWNKGPVNVRLSAVDNPDGSGVAATYYKLDDSPDDPACTPKTRDQCSTYTSAILVSGEGKHTLTYFSVDKAGNVEDARQLPINIDTTPPTIKESATVNSQPYTPGSWTNRPVTITFTCEDTAGGSGVDQNTASSPATLKTEGQGQEAKGSCTDKAGNSTDITVKDIDIDLTAPILTASHAPDATSYGWNKSEVTVTLSRVDTLSGVGVPPLSPQMVSEEGANQERSATCNDRAGNSAEMSVTINLDKTPPTITGSRTPPANSYGWNNTPISVHFTCEDALSGIATCPADVVLSTEGANQKVTGTAHDKADNTTNASVSDINIDQIKPAVSPSSSRPPDGNGWYNHPFSVSWQGTDALSGIAACDPATSYSGPDTASGSLQGTCSDKAGNSGTATASFKYDATPPTITCSASPSTLWPPDNKMVPITATVHFSDTLSGSAGFTLISVTSNEGEVATDVQGVAPGTASTSGSLRVQRSGIGHGRVYTLTYRGMDTAGNSATCAATVTVPHDQSKKSLTSVKTVRTGGQTIQAQTPLAAPRRWVFPAFRLSRLLPV